MKGTSTDQDARFGNKEKKLLKSLKFDQILAEKIDMNLIMLDTMKTWIAARITNFLGFEDEYPDPQKMQLQLTGFLEAKNARTFMRELWHFLKSAELNGGIPKEFVELRMAELAEKQKEEKLEQLLSDAKIETSTSLPTDTTNLTHERSKQRSHEHYRRDCVKEEKDSLDHKCYKILLRTRDRRRERSISRSPSYHRSSKDKNHDPPSKRERIRRRSPSLRSPERRRRHRSPERSSRNRISFGTSRRRRRSTSTPPRRSKYRDSRIGHNSSRDKKMTYLRSPRSEKPKPPLDKPNKDYKLRKKDQSPSSPHSDQNTSGISSTTSSCDSQSISSSDSDSSLESLRKRALKTIKRN